MVVLALRKVTTPVRLVAKPAAAKTAASASCAGTSNRSCGAAWDANHMNAPMTKITIGGGTFDSRKDMIESYTIR